MEQKALRAFFKRESFRMQRAITFLKEAKAELTRVNWPTRKQIGRYTLLVILISLAVAIFLGGLDYFFSSLVERFLIQ